MNNQSNLFEDIRGFILDTQKDMKLDFFFYFQHLLCLSSIETSFAHLRTDRRSPSIPPFFFFFAFTQPSSKFTWMTLNLWLFFFQPFLNHWTFVLSLLFHFCLFLFAPSAGCDASQGFLKENILSGSNGDRKG